MLHTEKMISIMILLCVFCSSVMIHFSYGIYQNFHVILENNDSDSLLSIQINEKSELTKSKLLSCLRTLPDEVNDAVQMYYLTPKVAVESDGETGNQYTQIVECRFAIANGEIVNSANFENNLRHFSLRGDFYTEEQQRSGAAVALVSDLRTYDGTPDKQSVTIQGKEYQVIGYSMAVCTDIPVKSLDDDTLFTGSIVFDLKKPITRPLYEAIKTHFLECFHDSVTVPELDIPNQRNQYYYRTILIIAFFISLITAFNLVQLYSFIFEKRKHSFFVMRICGCSRMTVLRTYLLEMLIIMIPVYALSVVVFVFLILPAASVHYPYMKDAFSSELYIILFLIIMSSTMISFSIMMTQKVKRWLSES